MDPLEPAIRRYPEEQHGRCTSCGFLSVVSGGYGTPRKTTDVDVYARRPEGRMFGLPTCLRQAADLASELLAYPDPPADPYGEPGSYSQTIYLAVIDRDRHCEDWYPFQPGLSSKQHLDQMLAMQVEHARREHERQLKELESKIATAGLRTAQTTKRLTFWGVVLALILVAIGLVSIYFASRPIAVQVTVSAPTAAPSVTP